MDPEVATDGGQSRPDWLLPGLRCALEVTLVLLITAFLWVKLASPFISGLIAVIGITVAILVLFWYLNEQALAWVRYASSQSKQQSRRRKEKRRKRQREQQKQQRQRQQ